MHHLNKKKLQSEKSDQAPLIRADYTISKFILTTSTFQTENDELDGIKIPKLNNFILPDSLKEHKV